MSIGPAPDDPLAALASGPPPGAPASIPVPGGGGPPGMGGPPPDLGGGGPPPGGGLPPELSALLGGGPEGGMEEPPDEEGGTEARGEKEILDGIRADLMEYLDVADDDIEKEQATKMLAIVQKLFASSQQQTEAAQGTTPAMKGMVKSIRG